MGYTLPQIVVILAKADRTMYKIGAIAYDDMFNQLDESLDYERDIIYIYKVAVEYADNFYVGTEKLDAVVERLGAKISIYNYGSLAPIYADVSAQINQVIDTLYVLKTTALDLGPGLTGDTDFTQSQIDIDINYTYLNSLYVQLNRTLTINGVTFDLSANRTYNVGTVTNVSFALGASGTDLNSVVTNSSTTPSITLNVPTASATNRGALSAADWNTFNGKQPFLGGTGLVKSVAGVISYITDNSSNWNTAYNDSIVSAAVTGTTTKTLTLNQQDGGTVTASWSDIDTGLTSVGLSMPSAFAVSNSPLTSNGTLAVTGAGTSAQYVRGDGQLANFPTNGGGGSSVNYYLNGSVNQGTFGGDTYYEMSKTPVLGAGTNFTRTHAQGNGYIASFITDAGDPALLNIPSGNWNLEFYFNSSASGGSPQFYAELYKVNASNVFTLVASGSANPEGIDNGTTVDQYFTSIPVPQTSLTLTDRLAVRIFIITAGRDITLHTENSNLCEVLTTFSTGLNALNGLAAQVQYFATGTSGTDFAISSVTDTHTFNLPIASGTNTGKLSNTDWTTFNNKQPTLSLTTTGASGASTFVSNTLNVPNYTLSGLGGVPSTRSITINGTTQDLSADRTFTVSAANIYTADGTLTGNRVVSDGGFGLSFTPTTHIGTAAIGGGGNGKLIVGSSTADNGIQIFGANSPSLRIENAQSGGTQRFAIGNATATNNFIQGATAGQFCISTQSAGNMLFGMWQTTNASEVMRITTANNLIINSSNDSGQKLQVNGNSKITGTLAIGGEITTTSNNFLNLNGAFRYFFDGSNPLRILTIANGFIINISSTGNITANSFTADRLTIQRDPESDTTTSFTTLFTSSLGGLGRNLNNFAKIISNFTTVGGGSVSNAPSITYINISKGNVTGYTSYRAIDVIDLNTFFGTTSGSVGIGATYNINASALLQMTSSTQGFLPPRMTTTERNAIASPATGLQVYNSTTNTNDFYNGTAWGSEGTVTSVAALTLGTSGTDLSSTVANGTTTPSITLNVPTASATNRGALSSADWTTFNNKVSSNIYTADGTLASARTLTHGGFNLTFVGGTHTNRFTSAGRLLLGTTTESTFLLDVNGTARVSGAITQTMGATNINILTSGSGTTSDRCFLIGNGTVTGNYNITIGHVATTSGSGSLNIGYGNNVSSSGLCLSSTAAGYTVAGGIGINGSVTNGGIGIGGNVTNGITIQGTQTGTSNIAIGYQSVGSGAFSIAMGYIASSGGRSSSIALGIFSLNTADNQLVIGGGDNSGGNYGVSDVYIGNGVQSRINTGAGLNVSINGSGGSGTNGVGANLTIAGGKGTGTGTSGDVIISTATPTTSGTTLQSLTQRVCIKGDNGNLLVGTTTDNGSKLQVTGAATFSSSVTASSLIKSGGTSAQILAADGSIITAGTNITISGGTISSTGGGGGSMSIGGSITGATAGSVLFAGVGGILAQNNANFYWDNTNLRLGIGTITPARKLDINGDIFVNQLTLGRGGGNVQSNSVLGFEALNSNTTGNFSVAIGGLSLRSQTGGGNNVSVGYGALQSITTQIHNVSVGYNALNLSTANSNVAIGSEAASSCTTASNIIAIGRSAFKNGTASNNLIIGVQTAELLSGSGANGNTLVGHDTCNASTTMQNSTALGYRAIANTTTGNNNIGIGFQAGQTINSGSNNIFIGVSTFPVLGSDSNRTFIGNDTTVTSWIGGNLLLGSKTDTGQRFQCSGTIRINGQTAATAGGSAGLHLIVNLDGTNYKIALLNV